MTETYEFLPRQDGSTVFQFRVRLQNRGWLSQLLFRLSAPLVRRQFRGIEANLRRLVEEEELLAPYAAGSPTEAGQAEP